MKNNHIAHAKGMHLPCSRAVISVEFLIKAVESITGTQVSMINILVEFHCQRNSCLPGISEIHK